MDRVYSRWPPPHPAQRSAEFSDSTSVTPDQIADDALVLHELKNHLSVVVGFCDLLLRDLAEDDPKRADILEMRKAANAALALVPGLSARMR